MVDTGSCFPLRSATWSVRAADAPTLPSKSSRKSLLSHFCWKCEPFNGCLSRVSKCQQSFSGTSTWSDALPPHIITCERQSFTSKRCKISSLKLVTRKTKKTRSSWLNCALRDDEALYWVSIGHYEAVAVDNWWYWVSRGHSCLYILQKVEIWTGVTDASLTHSLTHNFER